VSDKLIQAGNGFLGFFDRADQEEPTYDPPHDAPCPVCLEPVCAPLKTIILMWFEPEHRKRSYFYRVHKACYEKDPNGSDAMALNLIEGKKPN
jgi:hypothetical protein